MARRSKQAEAAVSPLKGGESVRSLEAGLKAGTVTRKEVADLLTRRASKKVPGTTLHTRTVAVLAAVKAGKTDLMSVAFPKRESEEAPAKAKTAPKRTTSAKADDARIGKLEAAVSQLTDNMGKMLVLMVAQSASEPEAASETEPAMTGEEGDVSHLVEGGVFSVNGVDRLYMGKLGADNIFAFELTETDDVPDACVAVDINGDMIDAEGNLVTA